MIARPASRLAAALLSLWPVAALTGQVQHARPSVVASRAGNHWPWQSDLDAALRAAKDHGRRVLWYVPTVPRSPMDRQSVLDLYVRAGWFSDPELAPVLRDFVLLDLVPDAKLARRYGLVPFRFVEPGFLVLDAEGKETLRAQALTTQSPQWLAWRLGGKLPERPGRHGEALAALRRGDAAAARTLLDGAEDPEQRFLLGAATWFAGQQAAARDLWRRLAADHAEHPQGWRAAAEAEGFGPVARGFYTWRELLPGFEAAAASTALPRSPSDLDVLRRRSVEFLLSMQGEHGGWEDSNYDFGGQDSLPNVYVAVSAICCQALFEQRAVDPAACDASVARGLGYVLDPKRMNPADDDEWIWARTYQIQLLAALVEGPLEVAEQGKDKLRGELAALCTDVFRRQGKDGAFRHEYPNPFATAAVLLALAQAEAAAPGVSRDGVNGALAALQRCRSQRGAFSYGQVDNPREVPASIKAAACRMPLCEAALHVWGKSTNEAVASALDAAFEHHGELEVTRKYDDHAGPLHHGGFFYWFDMLGRELAFQALERQGGDAAKWRAQQLATILQVAEIDGCFVDSHELGRTYGTAMALLCLPRAQPKGQPVR